jgi:hypothetical protein
MFFLSVFPAGKNCFRYTGPIVALKRGENIVPTEFLSNKELLELTEYQRKAQQCRELRRLGIGFKVSRSGRPLVLKEVVVKIFGGAQGGKGSFVAPDLEALERMRK